MVRSQVPRSVCPAGPSARLLAAGSQSPSRPGRCRSPCRADGFVAAVVDVSLGAASVRIQGMRGRYTRFLSDGLPLFGEQVGALGLLQIPPMDL